LPVPHNSRDLQVALFSVIKIRLTGPLLVYQKQPVQLAMFALQ